MCVKQTITTDIIYNVQDSNIWSKINPEFSCFNIDYRPTLNKTGILGVNLSNPALISFVKSLDGSMIRFGGSDSNKMIYANFNAYFQCPENYYFCLEPKRWNKIIDFSKKTKTKILFDLNLKGDCDKQYNWSWTKSNINSLFQYTVKNKLDIFSFELGNENQDILTGNQTTNRFKDIRNLMDMNWNKCNNIRPKLFGPSCHIQTDWIIDFVNNIGDNVDSFAYHLYPGYGKSSEINTQIHTVSFLDTSRMLQLQTNMAVKKINNTIPIMITETAAAWASGKLNVTNSFMDSFWYLDHLGTSAYLGHYSTCRQTLIGSNYSLIDVLNNWTANPDYFVLRLWHDLISKKELYMFQSSRQPVISENIYHDFRAYVFYKKNKLVFSYINIGDNSYNVSVQTQSGVNINNAKKELYVLQAPNNNLSSRKMLLNGNLIEAINGDVPKLIPIISTSHLTVPSKSLGFIVYKNVHLPINI